MSMSILEISESLLNLKVNFNNVYSDELALTILWHKSLKIESLF